MELTKAIIAILFHQAEPLAMKRLSNFLKCSEGDIRNVLPLLETRLSEAGLRLMQNGDELTLSTAPEASQIIESITKEELSKDLSKAAMETLAIVLYKGPITRSEIDYIRGVNSTFILRNLLVRGLVEKIENPGDQRSFLYKSTFQLLEYMGVGKIEELPDYHDAISQLEGFVAAKQTEEKTEADAAHTRTESDGAETPEASEVTEAMTDEEIARDIEADIGEMDIAGENYNDDAMHEHTLEDRSAQIPKHD